MAENASAPIRYARTENPFLTIFTPHLAGRPKGLARNQAMLGAQTCQDFEQIVIEDEVGRGFGWVAEQIRNFAPMARGQYVMAMDSDDVLAGPDVVEFLYDTLRLFDVGPEVILVKFGHIWSDGTKHIIPDEHHFRGTPEKGQVSGQNVIVRRDVYLKHAHNWRVDESGYAYDYNYISSLFAPEHGYSVLRLPFVVAEMQYRGLGRTEDEIAGIHAVAAGGR